MPSPANPPLLRRTAGIDHAVRAAPDAGRRRHRVRSTCDPAGSRRDLLGRHRDREANFRHLGDSVHLAGVHRVPGALAGAGILSLPAALGARRRHTRHALGRGIVVPNTRCRKWLDRLRFLTDAGASEADLEVLDALFGQHRRPAVLKNLSATDTTPAKNVQVLVAAAPLASVHAGYRVKKGSLQPAG